MYKHLLVSFMLLFLSTSFFQVSAQSKIIEKVNFKGFYGIFEIKNNGYFVCYRRGRNVFLEIYDKNLELVSNQETDYTINSTTFFDSRSNEKSFLTIIAKSKKRYIVTSYDFNGNATNSLDTKNPIIDIYSPNDEGYFFLMEEKGKTVVKFFDNELKEQWSEVALESTSNSLFDLYSKNSPMFKSVMPETTFITSDAIFIPITKSKGMFGTKILKQKLFGISTDGEILMEKDYDPNKYRLSTISEMNGKIYAMLLTGDFSSPLRPKMDNTIVEILDRKGNIIETVITDHDFFALSEGLGFMSYLMRSFFTKGNELVFILESISEPKFLIAKFDESFNLVSDEIFYRSACTKKKNSSPFGMAGGAQDYMDAILHKDFQFHTFSEDGELLIVYFHHDDSDILLKVSSESTKKNDTESVFDPIEDSYKGDKIKVRWLDIFPYEGNQGTFCFYNKKKRQIEMHVVEF